MNAGFPIEDCPGGPHTYDEYGNGSCNGNVAADPCYRFASQGFGPEGDYEHSLFCRICGWEYADHLPIGE